MMAGLAFGAADKCLAVLHKDVASAVSQMSALWLA